MIILVSGHNLDIKELTYAIINNYILHFDWFWAYLLQTLVYIYMHKALRTGPRQRNAYILNVLIDWGVSGSVLSVLYACLICINFNKYIHTLIKQIFDGYPSQTLYVC